MGGKGSPSLKSGAALWRVGGLQTVPLGSQNLLLQNFPSEANQLPQLSRMYQNATSFALLNLQWLHHGHPHIAAGRVISGQLV